MSDDRQQLLALDVMPTEAARVAERLRTWLRDRRFAVPHPDVVDPAPPNTSQVGAPLPADLIGPGFTERPHGSDRPGYDPAWSFLYVHVPHDADHRIWYLGDSTGPSVCRSCGSRFDPEPFWAAFDEWLGGPAPTLTCGTCGRSALMGDHDTSGSIVISAIGVVMSGDAGDLVPELLDALRTDFGGRWAWVSHHP